MKTNTLENGELKEINIRKCILLTSKSALVSAQNPLTEDIYNTLLNSGYGCCSLRSVPSLCFQCDSGLSFAHNS